MKKQRLIMILALYGVVMPTFGSIFQAQKISKKTRDNLITALVWQQNCPIPLTDLRLLSVSYYDFDGHAHHDGKLLVNQSIAQSTLAVFKKLYAQKFPFSSIETLINDRNNIHTAEEKNITYGFSCQMDQKNNFTPESFGNVLTINPTFNPKIKYVDNKVDQYVVISPKTAILSINRRLKLKGMIETVEPIFRQYQFSRLSHDADQLAWGKFIQVTRSHGEVSGRRGVNSSVEKGTISYTANKIVPTFKYEPLSEDMIANIKKSGAWFEGCPVALDRLYLLTLSYYDYAYQVHTGTLIVLDAIAPYLTGAFKELYHKRFPLEKLDANDGMSSQENTASFNCRNIVGKKNFSIHAYGLAIDINISRNPYIGTFKETNQGQMIGTIVPASLHSLSYLDRKMKRPGMNESIVPILKKYGFIEWGGNWQDTIDYMHFQLPTNIAKHLVLLDKKSAYEMIKLIIKYPEQARLVSQDTKWDYLYLMYPSRFIKVLKKYFALLKSDNEKVILDKIYHDLASTKHST